MLVHFLHFLSANKRIVCQCAQRTALIKSFLIDRSGADPFYGLLPLSQTSKHHGQIAQKPISYTFLLHRPQIAQKQIILFEATSTFAAPPGTLG